MEDTQLRTGTSRQHGLISARAQPDPDSSRTSSRIAAPPTARTHSNRGSRREEVAGNRDHGDLAVVEDTQLRTGTSRQRVDYARPNDLIPMRAESDPGPSRTGSRTTAPTTASAIGGGRFSAAALEGSQASVSAARAVTELETQDSQLEGKGLY